MNREGRSTLDSFQRVREFLARNPQAGAPVSLGAQVSELDDVVERLTTDSVGQEAGARFVRVHAKSQAALRESLYTVHLQPLSRVAREVLGDSGLDKAFRLPKVPVTNKQLLAVAGAMAEAAVKEKNVFVKHGLPEDFMEQLQADAAALATAVTAKSASARRQVTATAALKDQLRRGRKAVRLLNAILQPRLAKNPELLAAWKSAKRVWATPPINGADGVTTPPAIVKAA